MSEVPLQGHRTSLRTVRVLIRVLPLYPAFQARLPIQRSSEGASSYVRIYSVIYDSVGVP